MEDFPDDATGNALKELVRNGADISKPMEIDFFVACPSEQMCIKIAREAEKHGFRVSVEEDSDTGDWTCYCAKILVPSYVSVTKIEALLTEIATPFGGYSDGFGSFGNA